MNLMPLFKSSKNALGHEWCLQGHLRVSSQDLLMGQQVKLPSLTPFQCHGTENRENDWSSEGFEYPSGQKILTNLQQKAVYMTETAIASKKALAIFAWSIHDAWGIGAKLLIQSWG